MNIFLDVFYDLTLRLFRVNGLGKLHPSFHGGYFTNARITWEISLRVPLKMLDFPLMTLFHREKDRGNRGDLKAFPWLPYFQTNLDVDRGMLMQFFGNIGKHPSTIIFSSGVEHPETYGILWGFDMISLTTYGDIWFIRRP